MRACSIPRGAAVHAKRIVLASLRLVARLCFGCAGGTQMHDVIEGGTARVWWIERSSRIRRTKGAVVESRVRGRALGLVSTGAVSHALVQGELLRPAFLRRSGLGLSHSYGAPGGLHVSAGHGMLAGGLGGRHHRACGDRGRWVGTRIIATGRVSRALPMKRAGLAATLPGSREAMMVGAELPRECTAVREREYNLPELIDLAGDGNRARGAALNTAEDVNG